jgi:hypothetical protein
MEVFLRQEILKMHFEKNFLLDHNEFQLQKKTGQFEKNRVKKSTWFSFWWWSGDSLN